MTKKEYEKKREDALKDRHNKFVYHAGEFVITKPAKNKTDGRQKQENP